MSTNELATKIRELKELQALIDEATAEADSIKDELKEIMTAEGKEELSVDIYKIRYAAVKSSRFDSVAFKKSHAELYAQYVKTTETHRFSVA